MRTAPSSFGSVCLRGISRPARLMLWMSHVLLLVLCWIVSPVRVRSIRSRPPLPTHVPFLKAPRTATSDTNRRSWTCPSKCRFSCNSTAITAKYGVQDMEEENKASSLPFSVLRPPFSVLCSPCPALLCTPYSVLRATSPYVVQHLLLLPMDLPHGQGWAGLTSSNNALFYEGGGRGGGRCGCCWAEMSMVAVPLRGDGQPRTQSWPSWNSGLTRFIQSTSVVACLVIFALS